MVEKQSTGCSLEGNVNFTAATCPKCPCCGSIEYTLVDKPNANCICKQCGWVYKFNFNRW